MLSLGLCLAWLAAAFELAVLGLRAFGGHEFVFTGRAAIWMIPASYAAILGLAGLVAGVMTRAWARAERPTYFLLVSAAVLSMTFLFHPRLHLLAGALLAAGAGWQCSGVLSAKRDRLSRWLNAGALVGGALVAAAAAAERLIDRQREDRAAAALPSVAGPGPNVVLLVLDAVRASSLSLHGYPRSTTPRIAALARRGVVFDAALSTSPWTLPAHASLFTGRPAHTLPVDWEHPLDPGIPTLAEAFVSAGYRTAGFVGNVAYTSRETGLARGFVHYEDYMPSWADLLTASALGRFVVNNPRVRQLIGYHDVLGRRTAVALNAALLDWIGETERRPFFAFVNYYDAHEPYLPPPPFRDRFASSAGRNVGAIRQLNAHMAERSGKRRMPERQRELEQLAYDQAIAALDEDIGALVDALERRGLLQHTLVAITADHGEQFGEHGLFSHGNSLYIEALHVPLVLVGEGVPTPGMRRPDVVSTAQLPATLLELSAARSSVSLPGRSLFATAPSDGIVTSSVRPARNQVADYPAARGVMFSATSITTEVIANADGAFETLRLGPGLREATSPTAAGPGLGTAERNAIATARREAVSPGERRP